MTPNINTLATNLLISESKDHRKNLAERIVSLLESSKDVSPIEKHLKSSFFSVIEKCVENPHCKSRDDFFQLAELYNEKLLGSSSGSIAA